jgi:hypothetical protein
MTYYRVEFPSISGARPVSKRFRTQEKAKKHAKKVLGIVDDRDLKSKVSISAVDSKGPVIEPMVTLIIPGDRPRERSW